MSFKVYKAYFRRSEDPEEKYDLHVALFVRSGPHPEKHQGEVFHVIDDAELTTDEVGYLTFNSTAGILEHHSGFKEAVHIGSIPKDNMQSVRAICLGMPPVVTPHHIIKPDCVTWLDNLIYDLNEGHVVNFESSFEIPSQKKPLHADGFSPPSEDVTSTSPSQPEGVSAPSGNGDAPSSKSSPFSCNPARN